MAKIAPTLVPTRASARIAALPVKPKIELESDEEIPKQLARKAQRKLKAEEKKMSGAIKKHAANSKKNLMAMPDPRSVRSYNDAPVPNQSGHPNFSQPAAIHHAVANPQAAAIPNGHHLRFASRMTPTELQHALENYTWSPIVQDRPPPGAAIYMPPWNRERLWNFQSFTGNIHDPIRPWRTDDGLYTWGPFAGYKYDGSNQRLGPFGGPFYDTELGGYILPDGIFVIGLAIPVCEMLVHGEPERPGNANQHRYTYS